MEELGFHNGRVSCASWIRSRPGKQPHQQQQPPPHLVVLGRSGTHSSPPRLEIFSFDPKTSSLSPTPEVTCGIDGDPLRFAVHPGGDDIVCSTPDGCRLFELQGLDSTINLLSKDLPPLQAVGSQKCLAFSTDGSRLATGGEDGHLRILEWPSLHILLDEPRAHNSFRDMDISLDSEFLASTSTDGSARIWKITDGVPLTTLTRDSSEKIECCRFSRDGTKPFLFCTIQKGGKVVTAVWDMSTWNKIGFKRLLRKPTSVLSISQDGKYLALGSNDGDICVVEVKKMEICHWSKKLHLGTSISSIEFCPTERVVLSTSSQWGAIVTRLNVPTDWKEWQIYLMLLGLFLASAVMFYIVYLNTDSFWNPPGQPARPLSMKSFIADSESVDDQNAW